MSGIFSSVGLVKETATQFSVTAGAGTAGVPNIATLTKTTHGLRVGDVIVMTASTVTGYNGTWTITAVPDANTFVIQTGTVLLGAATATFPVVNSSAYGIAGVPSKFYEVISESVESKMVRVDAKALRQNARVMAANRYSVYEGGAEGDIELEVMSKGTLGYFLDAMMGTVVTTGPTDSAYTHTATVGSVRGKSFTYQKLVSQGGTNSVSTATSGQHFTFKGMKVKSWSLSCDSGGLLILKLSFMGQKADATVVYATPSYPATAELFSFAGGVITVAGAAVAVCNKISLDCDLKLGERRPISSTGVQIEPLETGGREFKLTLDVEFVDMVLYNKYVSATAAGALAAVTATFTAPTLIGATAFPSVTVTVPNFRVDGETPKISGPDIVTMSVSGPCLDTTPGAADAVTIAYKTLDSVVT